MIQVQLPDGTLQEHPDEATALDVGARNRRAAGGGDDGSRDRGMVVDAMRPLKQ
ncbi:MAG: hypothetical protein Ct9H300mP1_28770 [Planctomycetaceae bacterium]|nr:MAG: hypothetical protein Ct9H300mP1_28770 [Planctomycetaceae bacterium]